MGVEKSESLLARENSIQLYPIGQCELSKGFGIATRP